MRIEVLQYILTIAELGSISRAAERINIQKTSLSSALRAAERELGYTVFCRSPGGVSLTEKGAELIPIASDILAGYGRLLSIGAEGSRPISVYVNYSISELFFAEVYDRLFREVPELSLRIYKIAPETYVYRHKAADDPRQLAVDCYMSTRLEDSIQLGERRGFTVEPLEQFALMAYINRKNPLSVRESVTRAELLGQNLIFGIDPVPREPGGELTFGKNYKVADGAGFIQLLGMVNGADVVGIFPEYKNFPFTQVFDGYTEVVPVPIVGDAAPEITYTQCLIYPKKAHFSGDESELLSRIRQALHR